MRISVYCVLFIFLIFQSVAQSTIKNDAKSSKMETTYNRNALTVLVLNTNGKFSNDLNKASAGILIPSKYDNNLVETRSLKASSNVKSIQASLIKDKLPNQILAKWFTRQANGQFDMSLIHERGMYNATDVDVNNASASKLGMAQLKDAGEILVDHSYILVLDFYEIQNISDIYDKEDAERKAIAEKEGKKFEPVKRRENGWQGRVSGYVYRMSLSDSIMNDFYNNLWINETDEAAIIDAKKKKFDESAFPISFVFSASGMADGTQYNAGEIMAAPRQLTKDELFQQLINSGISSILFNVERKVEEFRVKTPLYATEPLRAKVGRKEGLYAEQRYFVYEFEQKENGETKANRKGVVRAKKVVDNRTVATGDSKLYTTFYQTAGFGLTEGMFLQQRNDFGIGVTTSAVLIGQMGGANIKVEANLGVLVGALLGSDLGWNQVKIYAGAGFQTREYTINTADNLVGLTDDFNFTRFQVGLSKGWYFGNNFSIAPFLGYGVESGTSEDWRKANFGDAEDGTQSILTGLVHYGAYSTINILHNFQVVGTLNMYSLTGAGMYTSGGEINGSKYDEIFEGRSGMALELGFRFEF